MTNIDWKMRQVLQVARMIGCLPTFKSTNPSDLYGSQAINYHSKIIIEIDVKVGKNFVYIYRMSWV